MLAIWEDGVTLLFSYLGLMVLGDLSAYFAGLIVERQWGPVASLWVFLTLYFLFLWVAWIIAVWLTNPKAVSTEQAPVLSPSDTLRPP
jgi:CDP-diglyceride synthetase